MVGLIDAHRLYGQHRITALQKLRRPDPAALRHDGAVSRIAGTLYGAPVPVGLVSMRDAIPH